MKIKIKKLKPSALIPLKATSGSAAYDLYCPYDFRLMPGRNVIPLYIALEMPQGIEAKIEPRSGYSSKGFAIQIPALHDTSGRKILDGYDARIDADVIVGKIDSDYRAGIGVIVRSNETQPRTVRRGQRIAQLTFYRVETADFEITETLSETTRGQGGFGHSGS